MKLKQVDAVMLAKINSSRNGTSAAKRTHPGSIKENLTSVATGPSANQPIIQAKGSASINDATIQLLPRENYFDLLVLVSRLFLLGLALYEVLLHCPRASYYASLIWTIPAVLFADRLPKNIFDSVGVEWGLAGELFVNGKHTLEQWFRWGISIFYDLLHPCEIMLDEILSFSLGEIIHVCFVCVFFLRGMILSSKMANVTSSHRQSNVGRQHFIFFLSLLSCVSVWIFLLPLFHECGSGSNEPNDFCFFVITTPERLKRKEGLKTTILPPRYSLADILLPKLYVWSTLFIKSKIKLQLWKALQRAFVNPFRFRGNLKKIFTVIRWSKFLAPLIGACNKCRGHILDMIKKKRQHYASKAAQKKWSESISALSKQSDLEWAVLQLQKKFREKKEAEVKIRLKFMAPENCGAVRTSFLVEQAYNRHKLEKTRVLDKILKKRKKVSKSDLADISRHEETLREQRKQLLLSPKTSFAVKWKYVAIACVALEIAQFLLAPILSGELTKIPLDELVSSLLFAPSCSEKQMKAISPVIFVPVSMFASLVDGVDDDDRLCRNDSLEHIWLLVVQIVVSALIIAVRTICFFDVFITFFTGELATSGVLVPKPFFARYVIPGIGLQIIVNPALIELNLLVKQVLFRSKEIGLSLCFHLLIVFSPFLAVFYDSMLDKIFDFVERENEIISHDIFC